MISITLIPILLLGAVRIGRAFTVSFSAPPLCNYTQSLNPGANPYVLKGEKVFLCVYVMSGSTNISSLTFQIPVDTYSILQMTGSYALINSQSIPTDAGAAGGYYIWTSTTKVTTSYYTTTTTALPQTYVETFLNSIAKQPVAGWPQYCDQTASLLYDGPTTTTTTTVAPGGVTTTSAPNTAGSTQQRYYSALSSCPWLVMTDTYVGSVLSLVINVVSGNIVSMVWDNQCYTCSLNSPECLRGFANVKFEPVASSIAKVMADSTSYLQSQGICGAEFQNCTQTVATTYNTSDCDFKILVTWAGTDRNGNELTTAGIRLSQFSGMSITSMYQSAKYSFIPPEGTGSSSGSVDVR